MEDPTADELFERLQGLGALRSRRMFGGIGLYCDDLFFGLIDDGVVYFKVDASTVPGYIALGAAPFNPFEDRGAKPMTGYYEVPIEVLERGARLREWATAAVEVARAAATNKKAKKKRAPRDASKRPIQSLLNIGPKSSVWLRGAGIATRADLDREGAVGAYRAVLEAGYPGSLNLLYALEGARLDLRWDRLPDAVKRNLRERLDASPTRRRKA